MAEDHWAEAPLAPESPEPQERESPTIFHQFGYNPNVPPEWEQPVWPPLPLAEAVRESEAAERQHEERLLRIHVANALTCVQYLDAHNRLLQHLLIQERKKTGHCPEDASGHCPHPTRLEQKYNVNTRPGKKIVQELCSHLPEQRRFSANMGDMERSRLLNRCYSLALVQFNDVLGNAAHDARKEMTLISEEAIASCDSLPLREGGPLFTPGIEDHDPTDPRNYEDDFPVSAPLFPDEHRD